MEIYPLFYKQEGKKIGIKNRLDFALKQKLRKCGELKYSKTYSCWYLPYEASVFKQLKICFPDLIIQTNNAPSRTEPTAHQTDIAGKLPTEKKTERQFIREDLRIVVCENKGWIVKCDFHTGMRIKAEINSPVWDKAKKIWFVPARKGNFEKLKKITAADVPLLINEKREFVRKHPASAKIELHEERQGYVCMCARAL